MNPLHLSLRISIFSSCVKRLSQKVWIKNIKYRPKEDQLEVVKYFRVWKMEQRSDSFLILISQNKIYFTFFKSFDEL